MADGPDWLRRQWGDIKGNFKWWLLCTFGGVVLSGLRWFWRMLNHMPVGWLGAVVTFMVCVTGLVLAPYQLGEGEYEEAAPEP